MPIRKATLRDIKNGDVWTIPPDVTELNLNGNEIGDAGATALAAALPDSQVTELYLARNKIGDRGAVALAAGLKGSHVATLYLHINEIGDKGIIALSAALKNSQVTELYLDGNNVSAEVWSKIDGIIEANRSKNNLPGPEVSAVESQGVVRPTTQKPGRDR